MRDYSIESFKDGLILVDYGGEHSKYGAAYCGREGIWKEVPEDLTPFKTEDEIWWFVEEQNGRSTDHHLF